MSSDGAREGPAPAGFGRAEDEDAVGLRRAPRLGAPQLRHLADGRDVVEGDPGQAIALRLGGLLPGPLGEADTALDAPTAVGLDVADDQHDHGVVGKDRTQAGQDIAQEREVRLAVVGVVERRVDLARVEPEEPGPQPVVVAVLDDSQIGRRRDDEPGAVRPAQVAQGRAGTRRDVACVAEERDAFDRRRRLSEEPVELRGEAVEHVPARRGERGPRGEVADVARRHGEGVRHELREVARALAVEDAGDRGGEEAVRPIVELQGGPDEQQLGERVRMEREGDLARDDLVGARRTSRRAGSRDERRAGIGDDPRAELRPAAPPRRSRRAAAGRVGSPPAPRVAGSTLDAVSRWANGLRSLPTPIRPSAQAWSGVVPRPENGSRTTSPGRE